MINQAAVEALYSASYVEDYLDYVENLPNDLQRNITRMRELDVHYQELLNELSCYEHMLSQDVDNSQFRNLLVKVQNTLIRTQEIGDEKLDIVQQIQDITENKYRQIDLDYRNLDIGQDNENGNENLPKEVPVQPERSSKRSRRQRNTDSINETSNHNDIKIEKENTTVASSVKKPKKKKRKTKAEREREQRSPSVEPPIDPDEPTYCLCEQVSFGEMIGCDNEDCPIEWFHFLCVQLTTKPKGKWYCPRCRGDRSNQPKPNLGKNNS